MEFQDIGWEKQKVKGGQRISASVSEPCGGYSVIISINRHHATHNCIKFTDKILTHLPLPAGKTRLIMFPQSTWS
jgi:hypothetical protein